jgi:hypothetical protein
VLVVVAFFILIIWRMMMYDVMDTTTTTFIDSNDAVKVSVHQEGQREGGMDSLLCGGRICMAGINYFLGGSP